jgi:hypothetical protein
MPQNLYGRGSIHERSLFDVAWESIDVVAENPDGNRNVDDRVEENQPMIGIQPTNTTVEQI